MTGHGIPRLIARKLCARGDRSVRLERLKAEVTAWPDERSGAIDVARPLMDGQGLAGNIELELGHPDAAIEYFQRAIALKPAYPRPWAGLAAAQALTGRGAEARFIAEKLRSLAPALDTQHLIDQFGRQKNSRLRAGLRIALTSPSARGP